MKERSVTDQDRPRLRDSFRAAMLPAAIYTLMKLSVPFAHQMITGYTDADIARMADQIIDTPFTFLDATFLMAAGHYIASHWNHSERPRVQRPAPSNGNTEFGFTGHNY